MRDAKYYNTQWCYSGTSEQAEEPSVCVSSNSKRRARVRPPLSCIQACMCTMAYNQIFDLLIDCIHLSSNVSDWCALYFIDWLVWSMEAPIYARMQREKNEGKRKAQSQSTQEPAVGMGGWWWTALSFIPQPPPLRWCWKKTLFPSRLPCHESARAITCME